MFRHDGDGNGCDGLAFVMNITFFLFSFLIIGRDVMTFFKDILVVTALMCPLRCNLYVFIGVSNDPQPYKSSVRCHLGNDCVSARRKPVKRVKNSY